MFPCAVLLRSSSLFPFRCTLHTQRCFQVLKVEMKEGPTGIYACSYVADEVGPHKVSIMLR